MKIVLSILILLVTCLYLLPVKELFKSETAVCMADMDEEKEETCNKEKVKDMINFSISNMVFVSFSMYRQQHSATKMPVMFYIIETPPPDNKS
jgi:hypothetical protein